MEGEGKEMVVSAEEHVGGLGYNRLGQSSVIKGIFLRDRRCWQSRERRGQ